MDSRFTLFLYSRKTKTDEKQRICLPSQNEQWPQKWRTYRALIRCTVTPLMHMTRHTRQWHAHTPTGLLGVSFLRLGVGHIIEGLQCALLLLSLAIYQATHCSHKLLSAGTHLIRGRFVNEALQDGLIAEGVRTVGEAKGKIAICKEEVKAWTDLSTKQDRRGGDKWDREVIHEAGEVERGRDGQRWREDDSNRETELTAFTTRN